MHSQSPLDKWFMRTKDIILAVGGIGGLGALFLIAVKYYNLPLEVQVQASEIKTLKIYTQELHEADLRVMSDIRDIKTNQDYTNKALDKQSKWLENISGRIK